MQTRKNASCWQLFVNALPSFNLSLLKLLGVSMLLVNHRALAVDANKFRFFSRENNSPLRISGDPCIQSYPGNHLVVSHVEKDEYWIAHAEPHEYVDRMDLQKQLRENTFVGDVFCNGKLQTLKDSRLQFLKDKTFSNSDYTVDFNEPNVIQIDFPKKP